MIADLSHKVEAFVTPNAAAILTAVGVVGTVGTAVLTGRASYMLAEDVRIEEGDRTYASKEANPGVNPIEIDMVTKMEMVRMAWPRFIPPIIMGGGTIAAIIGANHISAKRAAALAAAYSLSEGRLEEYKAKTLEKLGLNKEQKLRDEIAQDRVSANPNSQIIIVGSGDVLCYDMLTGRYFNSSVEKISKAMALIHSEIYNHMYASASQFFDELGLEPTQITDEIGWNSENVPDVEYATTMTKDDQPCMTISFTAVPKPDYYRAHSS